MTGYKQNVKSETNSANINPHDVLCGRGGLTNSHVGNKRFRYIVADYQGEYLTARKLDKKSIAAKIIDDIRRNGGRFLKQNPKSATWQEVSYKKALEKTAQALREGLDVKHKTVRPSKLIRRFSNEYGYGTSGGRKKREALMVEGTVEMSSEQKAFDPPKWSSSGVATDKEKGSQRDPLFLNTSIEKTKMIDNNVGGIPQLATTVTKDDESSTDGDSVPNLLQSPSRVFEPMIAFNNPHVTMKMDPTPLLEKKIPSWSTSDCE